MGNWILQGQKSEENGNGGDMAAFQECWDLSDPTV